MKTYIKRISHLERSSSVPATLLIRVVAHGDFLEQSSAREFKYADCLTSHVPENDSPILLTGCTERLGVGWTPRYVVYVVRMASGRRNVLRLNTPSEVCVSQGAYRMRIQNAYAHMVSGAHTLLTLRCPPLQDIYHHNCESSLVQKVFKGGAVCVRGSFAPARMQSENARATWKIWHTWRPVTWKAGVVVLVFPLPNC